MGVKQGTERTQGCLCVWWDKMWEDEGKEMECDLGTWVRGGVVLWDQEENVWGGGLLEGSPAKYWPDILTNE